MIVFGSLILVKKLPVDEDLHFAASVDIAWKEICIHKLI